MPETHSFQAEVSQVLHLVIHSLYSHKEIFLRELISNASDALDKLRFRALTEPALLEGDVRRPDQREGADANTDVPLEIRIVPDKEKGTLTIEDTGVGMTHDELVRDLGTVARSGSKAFLEQLKAKGEGKDLSLIGQFGVGFYSAYLVADRVEVVSRAAGTDEAWRWRSDGKESFFVDTDTRETRGTSIVLYLKDDQKEFLDAWRLKDLVVRYSDYVSHPIRIGGDTINKASALWQRPKGEITREQYEEFYKHLTHAADAPLGWTHFRVEGAQEFVGLVFLPASAPFELEPTRRRGVRLFVKRVFVMEDCEELLPPWLRFVRGVVDSDDLPLNVSREVLQDSSQKGTVRSIKKQVTKKTLDLLESIAAERPEDYGKVWASFGPILKEGLATDFEYKERLAGLARYQSSHGEGTTSLAEYVARMKPEQPAIYYVLGESMEAASTSPHLEALTKRGYEVLYMTDPIDEWATEALAEYDKKPLVSAMRADLKLGETAEEKKEREERGRAMAPLIERMTKVLAPRVSEVALSDRLTESPCCLVRGEHGPHAFVERVLRERGHAVPKTKRILEVNAAHPLIQHLEQLVEKDPSSPRIDALVDVLYGQALLTEGSALDDPNRFAKNLAQLLTATAPA
jgi:molecular chaperone HtpG